MSGHHSKKPAGRLQLLLIALIFAGPLIAAAWMYFGDGGWKPAGTSNHGALLEPIITLDEELPDSGLSALGDGHWILLYLQDAPCGKSCEQALFRLRQSRLMLGNEMSRVRRVFLHGDTPPDTVFIEEQHAGLITINNRRLAGLLERKRPSDLGTGGYYLIDPLSNLVMYFSPDVEPGEMVDDLKHLLELSRIG